MEATTVMHPIMMVAAVIIATHRRSSRSPIVAPFHSPGTLRDHSIVWRTDRGSPFGT